MIRRTAVALTALGLVAAFAKPPVPAAAPLWPSAAADGAAIYKERCAGCHDNGGGRVPTRELLSRNPASFILSTLRGGVMAPMAEGLSPAELVAVSRYLSKVPDSAKAIADVDAKQIWGKGVEGTPLDAPQCAAAAPAVDLGSRARWNGWGVTTDNARFQPEPGLAAADVPRLKLKWAFAYPGAKNGQATVIGDRLFVTSMSGAVYALDARSGCVYWRHAAAAATRTSVTVVTLPNSASAAHALFFSDWTKAAVALDADTGRQLWKTVVDDQPGLQMTGSITYWDGKIFVPISSGNEAFAQGDQWECCRFRGALVALDAVTGRILWKRYTTETVPHVFKTNAAGRKQWGPSGGSIWNAPTIDPVRRLVYVGTSNSYTDVPYDNADSIMAFDADSGAVRWVKQLTPDDNYIDGCWKSAPRHPANCPSPLGPDFSIGASAILSDASGRQLLYAASKSGQVFALDPADKGKVVWERRLSPGSALGGIEFGMADDGRRLYVGVSDIVAGSKGQPGLSALDPATGDVLWRWAAALKPDCRWKTYWCHGAISQAVTAIPGVVFVGAYDGHFRAWDTASGRVVWDWDTGSKPVRALNGGLAQGGVMDGAGATVAGGMVYVHSGYAGRSADTPNQPLHSAGNVLMAFSVDGK